MKAVRIGVDGVMQAVEITGKNIEQQNDSIHKMLGGYFECVRLAYDAVMLVDDEDLLKGLPENPSAMMFARSPMLVGTALIVGAAAAEDGEVFTDCPERFLCFADKIARI